MGTAKSKECTNADIYCLSDGKWEHEADVLKLIGKETQNETD